MDRPQTPHREPSPLATTGRWPQFRLRTLFIAVAVLSALMALAVRIGPVWSLAIFWTALLIAAHVLGNAWGSRGTADTSARLRAGTHDDEPPQTGPIEFAPTTRLHRSGGVGWSTIVLTALGVLAGGGAGAAVLIVMYAEQGVYIGIALGILCAAILGGFLGFLTATSLGMTLRAWREAVEHDGKKGG
ncbi:MAG: hypothetical protein JNM18_24505 [Planctomycetaceae bacterium]|nr:hypothetical protein [Planctomycetaceae bacterium]